eukprot:CAMPEP_0197073254 /NCGR_PEP_ID=MMETSP1384-20130603/210515_1 /TAXON_ID=29189 /ORGANISM="Ammonia sp." /LENGTH=348 /DNA_ID=CAMNT_0042512087 /DNA_START=438 /DNA_END=1484 /DNA_ORIENTATION=+
MPASFSTATSVDGTYSFVSFALQCVIALAAPYVVYYLIKSLCDKHRKIEFVCNNTSAHKSTQEEMQDDQHHILYWDYSVNQQELAATFGHFEHRKGGKIPLCLQRMNEHVKQSADLLTHIENDQKRLLQDIQGVNCDGKKLRLYSTLDVMGIFQKWLETARTYQPYLIKRANAVCVSTVDSNHCPQSRFVLLKQIELTHGSFIFYTNYNSKKAKQIESTPKKYASMTFYWHVLFCSVRITGCCEKLSPQQSDLYWKVRPKQCKLSAMSSAQSSVIANKQQLDAKYERMNAQFVNTDNADIPRPQWGGYALKAQTIEFWKGDSHRFHDRVQFDKTSNHSNLWTASTLQP